MIKLWVQSVMLTRWKTFDLGETNTGVLGQLHIFEVKNKFVLVHGPIQQ